MRRAAALLLLFPALSASLGAQQLPAVAAASRVADSLARDFIAAGGAPSVAIGVVRGADTIVLQAWGIADLELNVPASAGSVYRIGSVTKQFTAAAVMQLLEQGKARLDDSIATHLSGLPVAWGRVTIRQLLNHTSGIPSYTSLGQAWEHRWGEEMTPDTLVALTAAMPMWFEPGSEWRYDNSGYVVLGMLIEKLTGRSWGADLEQRFTRPLGLSDTRNCLVTPIIPNRVPGYEPAGKAWVHADYLAMSQPYAAGAICSTVGDLAKWNRALHTGKVVSAESYALMTTPEGAAAAAPLKYGFGLGRDTVGGRPVITHGGGIHGFISANLWMPDVELSVTVLTNSGSAPAGRLQRQLVLAALGMPLEQPAKEMPLAAADRVKYLGVYALALPSGPRDFTIAEEEDHLTAQLAGQVATPILFYGDDTFGMRFDPALRLIFEVENGRATKVVLLQGGGRYEGRRK